MRIMIYLFFSTCNEKLKLKLNKNIQCFFHKKKITKAIMSQTALVLGIGNSMRNLQSKI